MGWDILLFDLDGTLTDSGPGIMHAAKTALQSFGIDGLSERELRYFVGPPLWESFGKYLPEEQISAAIDRFREYYRVTGLLENEPYPGVRECLQALQGAGKRMYVATSKLETMARQVLAHFDLLQYFAGVCGGSAEVTLDSGGKLLTRGGSGGREEGQCRATGPAGERHGRSFPRGPLR